MFTPDVICVIRPNHPAAGGKSKRLQYTGVRCSLCQNGGTGCERNTKVNGYQESGGCKDLAQFVFIPASRHRVGRMPWKAFLLSCERGDQRGPVCYRHDSVEVEGGEDSGGTRRFFKTDRDCRVAPRVVQNVAAVRCQSYADAMPAGRIGEGSHLITGSRGQQQNPGVRGA